MTLRSTVVAVIVFFGSLVAVQAQQSDSKTLGWVDTSAGERSLAVALGWNWVHATNCMEYFDGTNSVFVVFPEEGGALITASQPFRTLLAPACQEAHLIAFYVINADGTWNRVFTYPGR